MQVIDVSCVGNSYIRQGFHSEGIPWGKRPVCSDSSLARLLRTAIEGPELSGVTFEKILDVLKEKSRRVDQ